MPSLAPCGSNEPSPTTGDGRGRTQWLGGAAGAAASPTTGDDEDEAAVGANDSDDDSVHGDAKDVSNLSLGTFVTCTYVDVLSPL